MITERQENEAKSDKINIRLFIANSFLDFIKEEIPGSYNLEKLSFNVQTESTDPDGTKNITIKPLVSEASEDLGKKGFYLLTFGDSPRAYLMEFGEPSRYENTYYFIGINSVTNPHLKEDKRKWVDEALKRKVTPFFYNQFDDVFSSIVFVVNGSEDVGTYLYGCDGNLEKFREKFGR